MKKIFLISFFILILALVGCEKEEAIVDTVPEDETQTEPADNLDDIVPAENIAGDVSVDVDSAEVDSDMSELDSLESDLDFSELDNLDQELAELDW